MNDHDERTREEEEQRHEQQQQQQQPQEAAPLAAAASQINERGHTTATKNSNTTPLLLVGRKKHGATAAVAQMTPKPNSSSSIQDSGAAACSNALMQGTASTTCHSNSKKQGGVTSTCSINNSSSVKHNNNNNKTMTQESSQPLSEILTQNPDCTQLGGDDDDDEYDDADGFIFSPFSPTTTRRQLPWARIILPEASSCSSSTGNIVGGRQAEAAAAAASVDLIPRAAAAAAAAAAVDTTANTNRATGISFLGLDNLQPGDPFNEYVIGRSSNADIVALPPSSSTTTASSLANNNNTADDDDAAAVATANNNNNKAKIIERKVRDWAFCMISNRHCRIFCTLEKNLASAPAPPLSLALPTTTGQAGSNSSKFHMQVYVEDMSGNGTLINKTTLLRKGERRLLHSGDEICLVNPTTLRKKVKSKTLLQSLLHQHSFVFINLLSQQLASCGEEEEIMSTSTMLLLSSQQTQSQHSRQSMMMLPPPPPSASSSASLSSAAAQRRRRKSAVNVRALNHHHQQQQQQQPRSSGGIGGISGILKHPPPPSPALHLQPQLHQQRHYHHNHHHSPMLQPPASNGTTTSFASLLRNNRPKTTASSAAASAAASSSRQPPPARRRRRRVEEDYDIREVLGMGTVGQVRRAVHRQTGQERAVKTMTFYDNYNSNNMNIIMKNKNNMQSAAAATENENIFQAEAAILQGLDHPYIVRLLDVYVSDTAVHLVMDLLPGGDLFDRIVQKGKYTEVASRRVMRRLLAAISYLHQDCNIVHRDLKPENILLQSRDNDVNVQITDFGLAKPVQGDAAACCKTFCGTPQYFAPEVLSRRHSVQKRGRYGKPADQWSLGVILYVLLSGTPPFEVSHFGNMLDGATFDVEFPPEHWAGISDQAKDLVRKLLVADPQERLTVEQAMQHDWINTEDGDTHVFPLDDPKLKSVATAAASTSTKQPNVQQQPQQVFQKRLFTAVTGKSHNTAAAVAVSASGAVAASVYHQQQQQAAAENNNLVKNHVGEQQQQQCPQKRSAVSVADSTQISPEPALAAKKKRSDLEPSSFDCSEEEPNTDNNINDGEGEDAHDPPCQETTTSTTNLPPRVSDVAPPLLSWHNKADGEPRRPLSPTSFNTNRHEMMMKTQRNKNGEKNHAYSSLSSSTKLASDDPSPTLLFGSSAFGVAHAKSQADQFSEENDTKAAAVAPLASLANQPVLETDDILSDFSEKTESIGSFGGGGAGGDSMGSFASKKAAGADLAVTKPEPRRLKKRKEQQQQSNGHGGGDGSTATSSVAAPKRRRVSALMSDSLASLEPMSSTTTTTMKKVKSITGKQRATRKTKEQKSQKTKQQQQHGHQMTLSGWVKK